MNMTSNKTFLAVFFMLILFSEAWGISWPVDNPPYELMTNFGQYQEYNTNHYFHPGIDILKPNGTIVKAVADGKIADFDPNDPNEWNEDHVYNHIAQESVPGYGWLYAHVWKVLGNPRTGLTWKVGEEIYTGEALCEIVPFGPDHLHFSKLKDAGGYFENFLYDGNPLEFLEMEDTEAPWLPTSGFHFYDVENETYIDLTDLGETYRYYLKGNIDIIRHANDKIGNSWPLAPYKIGFSIDGPDDHDVPYQNLVTCTGQFAYLGLGTDALFIYADDGEAPGARCNSNSTGDQYYILTHQDDRPFISEADTFRYWDTDGKIGEAWNDIDEHDDHEASCNADAAFPDGYYQITCEAEDLGQNISTIGEEVYVNNFNQSSLPCNQRGQFKPLFDPEEPVYVKGSEYLPDQEYEVLIVEDKKCWPRDKAVDLSTLDIYHSVFVTTNSDGEIPPTDIRPQDGFPEGTSYDIIIDYDRDGYWSPPVDDINIDGLANNLIGTGGFCVAAEPGPACSLSDCLESPLNVTARCSGSERESDMDKGYTLGGVVVSWEYPACPNPSLYDLAGISGFNIYKRESDGGIYEFKCHIPLEEIDYYEPQPNDTLHMEEFIHWSETNMEDIFIKGEYAVAVCYENEDLEIYIESDMTDSEGLEVRASQEAPVIEAILFQRWLIQYPDIGNVQYGVVLSYPAWSAGLPGLENLCFYVDLWDETGDYYPDEHIGYCFPAHPQYNNFQVYYDEFTWDDSEYENVFVFNTDEPEEPDYWYLQGVQYDLPYFNAGLATTYSFYSGMCDNYSLCALDEYAYNKWEPPFGAAPFGSSDWEVEGIVEGYPTYYKRWYEGLSLRNKSENKEAENLETDTAIPSKTALHKNHPNPFNPTTIIRYDLAQASNIRLSIYNIDGKLVKMLIDGGKQAGYHSVEWNGKDEDGRQVPSGAYFYQLETSEGYKETKRMILLK
jgi:hypothetical protein